MKAQADIVYLIAAVLAVAIGLLAVDMIWNALAGNPAAQQLFNATSQGQLAERGAGSAISTLNNAVVILFIIAAVASIIAAAFADSSPIFLVPALVLLPLEIMFAFIFHDAFFQIVSNSSFASAVAQYPSMLTLFQYLPVICFVVAIIEIIVTFVK